MTEQNQVYKTFPFLGVVAVFAVPFLVVLIIMLMGGCIQIMSGNSIPQKVERMYSGE